MKLSILQENLHRGLAIVSRAVSSRSQLPILTNILLKTDGGRLKLTATNLEIGLNYWIGAKIENEGAITIPAKLLTEFVSSLPAGKIDLEVEGGSLKLNAGIYKANFMGLGATEFPPVASLGQKPSLELSADSFCQAIGQVAFAAAQDESRPVLSGVYLVAKEDGFMMVATDGYRLSFKKFLSKEEIGGVEEMKKGAIVPASALFEVARIRAGETEAEKIGLTFTSEANQVIFSVASGEVISRLIEGQFPDFEKIMPGEGKTKFSLSREEFLRAVKMGAIFARESANVIRLEAERDVLKVSANSSQVGDNLTSIEVKIEGEGGKIAFNSRYLLDFLSSTDAENIGFEMSGPLNPGSFTSQGDSSYRHIIMPVRVQE